MSAGFIPRNLRSFLRRFYFIVLIFLSLVTVLVSTTDSPFSLMIRTKMSDIFVPVFETISAPVRFVSSSNTSFKDYFLVYEKNKLLKEERDRLMRRLIELSLVENENRRLKDLLGYVKEIPYEHISARIVGDTKSPFIRSVIVNAGQQNNIKKGQAVVEENGLVGRIIEAGEKSSRVLLLTDINSNIPVITGAARERCIISGNNDNDPILKYLDKETKVQEGEIIITSGDGGVFPAGIKVGVVYKNNKGEFLVKPFVKWHRLEHVSILEYEK